MFTKTCFNGLAFLSRMLITLLYHFTCGKWLQKGMQYKSATQGCLIVIPKPGNKKIYAGSIHASFSFSKLMSSSTATALSTLRFTISLPRYNVILPTPLPT